MKITIKNCNNIDHGIIEIKANTLNIKHGINGTGKSTIAKALISATEESTHNISELKPFKHALNSDIKPEINQSEPIEKIKIFDERYINDFVFQADELLKGSFDILIRGEDYEKGMQDIEELTKTMHEILAQDKDLESLIADFNEISNSFGKTTKQGFHGSSNVAKALKSGNKVETIPNELKEYSTYIQHEQNYKWLKWQQNGTEYIEISSDCPFCTHDIETKKEKILKVSEIYEPKSIENLNKIVATFQRLNKYFSDQTKEQIEKFLKNISGYTDDQANYLREVKEQIERLNTKFMQAQKLGFISLKDVDKVLEELKNYRIDLSLFTHLNSSETSNKAGIVNNAIDQLINKAGELQGSIRKQKILIERLVKQHKIEINSFLKNAGYQYSVDLIEDERSDLKLKLIHNDNQGEIQNVRTHLSYGERNAFSLVLFMYDALKSKPSLIILDDPISSFDKNKKYAIIEMLFRRASSFRGKSVLLLTHDFDPIVDMVLHHSDRFEKPYATFLENNQGALVEKEITREDIKTFLEINTENLNLHTHEINRLVYLRRHHEITNQKDFTFDVISNLFHKREVLTRVENQQAINMTAEEIQAGIESIKRNIPTFDYQSLLNETKDNNKIKDIYNRSLNNYEKLHIYRIAFDDKNDNIESDVIRKFINEAFHIENNYIYQLNPNSYQLVPQYVIDECDRYMAML